MVNAQPQKRAHLLFLIAVMRARHTGPARGASKPHVYVRGAGPLGLRIDSDPTALMRLLVGFRQINRGGAAVLLLLNLKSDLLAFIQTAQPRLLHGADVNENVLAPRIRRNEPITLCWIEPFYGALRHRPGAFLPLAALRSGSDTPLLGTDGRF